jgi:hypothetical protein
MTTEASMSPGSISACCRGGGYCCCWVAKTGRATSSGVYDARKTTRRRREWSRRSQMTVGRTATAAATSTTIIHTASYPATTAPSCGHCLHSSMRTRSDEIKSLADIGHTHAEDIPLRFLVLRLAYSSWLLLPTPERLLPVSRWAVASHRTAR